MDSKTALAGYVRDALDEGRTTDDVRAALGQAGWTSPEIDAALAGWMMQEGARAIPRPIRSHAARDAFFYGFLFIVLGVVLGNLISLGFGLITFWVPDPAETFQQRSLSSLRWSMSALIVFVPAFWFLHSPDTRAGSSDPSRQHGVLRRWLTALAMLAAVITLMGTALFIIFTWLEGQLTVRFSLRTAVVCGVALIVLGYFSGHPRLVRAKVPNTAAWAAVGFSTLAVVLSFFAVGGPGEGRLQVRDNARIRDLRVLANDLENCRNVELRPLPDALDPLDCASNPERLSGFSSDVIYARVNDLTFDLCIGVERPELVFAYDVSLDGSHACIRRRMN